MKDKLVVQGRYLGTVEGEVVPKLIEGSAGKTFRGKGCGDFPTSIGIIRDEGHGA